MSTSITDAPGLVAIASGVLALIALGLCALLAVRLRRVRAGQRVVLGETGERDVVAHGADLEIAFDALRDYVGDIAERLDTRTASVEAALRGAITHRALVRYDAYNELSGHQSMSIALLDATRSGVVLSSIHHRDQARLYAKLLTGGSSELELSPEEAEAVRAALAEPESRPSGDGGADART